MANIQISQRSRISVNMWFKHPFLNKGKAIKNSEQRRSYLLNITHTRQQLSEPCRAACPQHCPATLPPLGDTAQHLWTFPASGHIWNFTGWASRNSATWLHLLTVFRSSEMKVYKVPRPPQHPSKAPQPCITSIPPWNSSGKSKMHLPPHGGTLSIVSTCLSPGMLSCAKSPTQALEPQPPPKGSLTLSLRERGLLSAWKRNASCFPTAVLLAQETSFYL